MPEDFGSVLPLLCCSGMALFFAVVVIPFLALLFRSAQKRRQLRSSLASMSLRSIDTLKPGQGLVRLRGVISQVPEPVSPFLDVAVLRLALRFRPRMEEREQEMDRVQTRPFLLDDGTGMVWVDPANLDRSLLGGEGLIPTGQERLDALRAVGLPPDMAEGHIQVWALRAGQEVTVVGTVQQRGDQMVIAKAKGQPLVVSTGDISELTVQAGRQTKTAWVVGGVLGVIGLCLLAVSAIALLRALQTLLGGG